jgi:hypothetical protein
MKVATVGGWYTPLCWPEGALGLEPLRASAQARYERGVLVRPLLNLSERRDTGVIRIGPCGRC